MPAAFSRSATVRTNSGRHMPHAAGALDQRLHDERDGVAGMAADPAVEHGEARRLLLLDSGSPSQVSG